MNPGLIMFYWQIHVARNSTRDYYNRARSWGNGRLYGEGDYLTITIPCTSDDYDNAIWLAVRCSHIGAGRMRK